MSIKSLSREDYKLTRSMTDHKNFILLLLYINLISFLNMMGKASYLPVKKNYKHKNFQGLITLSKRKTKKKNLDR